MRRRDLLATLAAAATPGLAFAPGLALADVRRAPISKAFPFLEGYLSLPPAERNRFYIAYRAMRAGARPAPDAHAVIVAPNGARTPLVFDREGTVTRLPSLAQLRSGASVETNDPGVGIAPDVRAVVPLSTHIDVAQLAAALAQASAARSRFAGVLSFAAPKLDACYFPGAGAGRAVMADGKVAPLPTLMTPIGRMAYFEPAAAPGARTLIFDRPPSRIALLPHPKNG